MLNPVHLRTLAVVIRTGSFADAARQIGYTGSAVSQQVAALERAVQLPLFERDAHSIRPTPAAEFLAERATSILAALASLDEDIRGLTKGDLGRLRLGSFPTASEQLLPAALAHYRGLHPSVDLDLDEGEPDDLVAMLHDALLDVAIVYRYDLVPPRWPPTLAAQPLLHEDLILLLPRGHRLADEESVTLADLDSESWVTTREGTAGATCLQRICSASGFAPAVSVRSNDYDVIRGFVRSGLGIALIPSLAHVHADDIVATQIDGLEVRRHVVSLSRTAQPSTTAAVDSLRRASNKLAMVQPGLTRAGAPAWVTPVPVPRGRAKAEAVS
ncbi:LysR family transcriptional regulator [Nocardioides sp. AN3]